MPRYSAPVWSVDYDVPAGAGLQGPGAEPGRHQDTAHDHRRTRLEDAARNRQVPVNDDLERAGTVAHRDPEVGGDGRRIADDAAGDLHQPGIQQPSACGGGHGGAHRERNRRGAHREPGDPRVVEGGLAVAGRGVPEYAHAVTGIVAQQASEEDDPGEPDLARAVGHVGRGVPERLDPSQNDTPDEDPATEGREPRLPNGDLGVAEPNQHEGVGVGRHQPDDRRIDGRNLDGIPDAGGHHRHPVLAHRHALEPRNSRQGAQGGSQGISAAEGQQRHPRVGKERVEGHGGRAGSIPVEIHPHGHRAAGRDVESEVAAGVVTGRRASENRQGENRPNGSSHGYQYSILRPTRRSRGSTRRLSRVPNPGLAVKGTTTVLPVPLPSWPAGSMSSAALSIRPLDELTRLNASTVRKTLPPEAKLTGSPIENLRSSAWTPSSRQLFLAANSPPCASGHPVRPPWGVMTGSLLPPPSPFKSTPGRNPGVNGKPDRQRHRAPKTIGRLPDARYSAEAATRWVTSRSERPELQSPPPGSPSGNGLS